MVSQLLSRKRILIVLLLLSVLPMLNLLHQGFPLTHDGQDHIARIANFYQSLSEGNPVPRWAGNLNWGYGHPILMFLYPLPSYATSLIHFLGFSFENSTKIVFLLGFLLSIFTMFWWVSEVWGTTPGFIAGLLYGFAPYRFVDLYVRGALGEHIAFIFPPLVMLGLYKCATTSYKGIWGSVTALSLAGLILSHNAVSIMFLPLVAGYCIYCFAVYNRSQNYLAWSAFYISLGFGLAAFFWIPAFVEGKYTLRDIVTKGDITDRLVPLSSFFYSPWSYGGGNELTKEIGLPQWIYVAVSLAMIFKAKLAQKRFLLAIGFLAIVASLWIMSPLSRFIWLAFPFLMNFQFPWRFLSVSVFVTAVVGGIACLGIPKKYELPVLIGTVVIAFISTYPMWHARSYFSHPESFYSGVYHGTTDTGESSPIWSVRFMESEFVSPVVAIDGDARITDVKRQSERHGFIVDVLSQKARILDNTLYFPGWTVYVDNSVVSPIDIWYQDPNYRGLINFWVDKGRHSIKIEFLETKLRKTSNIISLAALAAILVQGSIIFLKPKP